jgi:zinc and cadmium transporter
MGLIGIALILTLGATAVTAIAALFLLLPEKSRALWMPLLISFATGCLLATAFLVSIPDSARQMGSERAMQWVLGGILLFFLLEKLVLFRHCHEHDCQTHKAAGMIVLLGDAIHSFFDGVIIASAFHYSTQLGIAASISILLHEIPQEVGDFAILVHSGFSRKKALLWNYMAALPAVAGGILTHFFLSTLRHLTPIFMAVSAASMIYVAISDLVPGLHKHTGPRAAALQFTLLSLGILVIALLRSH